MGRWQVDDPGSLEPRFEGALESLSVAFQPVVKCSSRQLFGFEALVCSHEPEFDSPETLARVAERLGRVHELGRTTRQLVAERLASAPPSAWIFVNVHPADFNDEQLYRPPTLSRLSHHIVLELTNCCSFDRVNDLEARITRLRDLGFGIAINNLGVGCEGLACFDRLVPDVVKLDTSLIRGVDVSPRKQSIIRAMLCLCGKELGMYVICTGIETEGERSTLERLGADLLQGCLLGRATPQFLVPDGLSAS